MTVTEPPPGNESPITVQPVATAAAEPKRRVSIASDPVAYDNLGYDLNHPRRKISQV